MQSHSYEVLVQTKLIYSDRSQAVAAGVWKLGEGFWGASWGTESSPLLIVMVIIYGEYTCQNSSSYPKMDIYHMQVILLYNWLKSYKIREKGEKNIFKCSDSSTPLSLL